MKIGEAFNRWTLLVGVCIPESLAASKAFSPTARLVNGHLARRAGQNRRCFPSQKDIGDHVGVGEAQAKRALRERTHGHLLRISRREDSRGRQTSEYEFLWHELLEESLRGQGA